MAATGLAASSVSGLVAAGLPGPRSLLSFLTDGVADPDHTRAAGGKRAGGHPGYRRPCRLGPVDLDPRGRRSGHGGQVARSAGSDRSIRATADRSGRRGTVGCRSRRRSLLAGPATRRGPSPASVPDRRPQRSASSRPARRPSPSGTGAGGLVDPAPSAGSTIAVASPAPQKNLDADSGRPVDGRSDPVDRDRLAGRRQVDGCRAVHSKRRSRIGGQTPSSPAASASATANTDATTADPDSAPPTPTATTDPSARRRSRHPEARLPRRRHRPHGRTRITAARPHLGDHTADRRRPPGSRRGPRRGSLWSIAAHRLPPDSTDADIDTAWRAWYLANEEVIGDNPDLIQPGQQLLPPTTK